MTGFNKLSALAAKIKEKEFKKRETITKFYVIRKLMQKCKDEDYKYSAKTFRQIKKVIDIKK